MLGGLAWLLERCRAACDLGLFFDDRNTRTDPATIETSGYIEPRLTSSHRFAETAFPRGFSRAAVDRFRTLASRFTAEVIAL